MSANLLLRFLPVTPMLDRYDPRRLLPAATLVVLLAAPAAFADPPSSPVERSGFQRAFTPPAHRPLIEGAGTLALALPARDDGLTRGREARLQLFARPIPYVAVGWWYTYRIFDWEARGRGTFYSPHETAWTRGWGFAVRGYPLAQGRLEPYLQVGLGGYKVYSSLPGDRGDGGPTVFALRSGVGLDVYFTRWTRVGLFASVVGPNSTPTVSIPAVYYPDAPPGAPFTMLRGAVGLSLTVGVPVRHRSRADAEQSEEAGRLGFPARLTRGTR